MAWTWCDSFQTLRTCRKSDASAPSIPCNTTSGTLTAKGVDTIACIAVNDPWVMDAWGKDQGVEVSSCSAVLEQIS